MATIDIIDSASVASVATTDIIGSAPVASMATIDNTCLAPVVSSVDNILVISADNSLVDDCVVDILGCELPTGNFYTQPIPQFAAFEIPANTLDKLSVGNGKHMLLKGQWQSVFIEGLKQSNDKCCFAFERHRVCGDLKADEVKDCSMLMVTVLLESAL